MKRTFFIGALVGFSISVAWGFASFAFFNVPEGTFSRMYWVLYRITVPLNFLTTTSFFFLDPFINAFVYGLLSIGFSLILSAAWSLRRA